MRNDQGRARKRLIAAMVILGAGPALWCGGGGGGGGGGVVPSVCIQFLPAASPAPNTVVARNGAGSTCDVAEVEIVVTDVTDVFAASFTVTFDPAVAAYQSVSTAGSHLASDGAQLQVLETPGTGQVTLGITRVGVATGIDFTGTQRLARLRFVKAPGASSGGGPLAFGNPKLLGSETPPVEKPGISWSGGTLQIQ